MNQILQNYLDHLARTGAREASRNEARRVLARIDKWLDGRDLTQDSYAGYGAYLSRCDLESSTKNKMAGLLKAAVRHDSEVNGTLWRTGAIAHFKQDKTQPRVLTRDEIARVWAACDGSEVGKTVRALLLTGARHSEILSLEPCDLTQSGVRIRAENAKNRRERTVPWAILHDQKDVFAPPFTWSQGGFNAIMRQAGVEATPKDFRSTHVTYAWSAKGSEWDPQHICGWCGHTLQVAQARYVGPLMYDVEGDTVAKWYGLSI